MGAPGNQGIRSIVSVKRGSKANKSYNCFSLFLHLGQTFVDFTLNANIRCAQVKACSAVLAGPTSAV